MQKANQNAPKILEALRVLGDAQPDHIAFALLGLPHTLTVAAQSASQQLQPVAQRLKSRLIASKLRIEMARMRDASAFANVAGPVSWSELPWADIMPTVVHYLSQRPAPKHSRRRLTALGHGSQTVEGLAMEGLLSDDSLRSDQKRVHVSDDSHEDAEHLLGMRYLGAQKLAPICRGCDLAVREWRRHESTIIVYNPTDDVVRAIARDADSLTELQLHEDEYTSDSRLTNSALSALLAGEGCPLLKRLLVRGIGPLEVAGMLRAAVGRARLEELDLVNTASKELGGHAAVAEKTLVQPSWLALCEALPHLRFVVRGCDRDWLMSDAHQSRRLVPRLKCVRCTSSCVSAFPDGERCRCIANAARTASTLHGWTSPNDLEQELVWPFTPEGTQWCEKEMYGRSAWFTQEELALRAACLSTRVRPHAPARH